MSRWIQSFLLTAGFGLLLYVGYVEIDSRLWQEQASRQLSSSSAPLPPDVERARGLVGRLEIPRIALSVMVNEGTSPLTLRRGVGHVEDTAMPGKSGNIGLAGHRDTFFLPLRNVRRHDLVTLVTQQGTFRYRVVSTRIVAPTEVSVLASDAGQVLTLVTCYPFYFVGAAPKRFIVRAERHFVQDE